MPGLLEIHSVTAAIAGKIVLRDVTLTVEPGGITSVLGPNGAGKTSLLRAISGVLQVVAGKIVFAGKDITNEPAWRIARAGIAHVPQGRRCFGPLTVLENLKMGGFSNAGRITARLADMFELFPVLAEKAKQPAASLSGGQQQMLAVARALMSSPRLLLLDEPTLGLAPLYVRELRNTLSNLGVLAESIVLVEQSVPFVRFVGGCYYVLRNGEFVVSGASTVGLDEQAVINAYLGYGDLQSPRVQEKCVPQ